MDFLNYIPKSSDQRTILVGYDVTSLYTDIPHELGVEAINFRLTKHWNHMIERFSKTFILERLKLILENNYFFDNKFYLQIKGTVIGTEVAFTYSTLVMGFLETKLYSQLTATFN